MSEDQILFAYLVTRQRLAAAVSQQAVFESRMANDGDKPSNRAPDDWEDLLSLVKDIPPQDLAVLEIRLWGSSGTTWKQHTTGGYSVDEWEALSERRRKALTMTEQVAVPMQHWEIALLAGRTEQEVAALVSRAHKAIAEAKGRRRAIAARAQQARAAGKGRLAGLTITWRGGAGSSAPTDDEEED